MCVMAKRWRNVCTGQKANAFTRRTPIHCILAAGVSRLKLPPAGIMSGLTSAATLEFAIAPFQSARELAHSKTLRVRRAAPNIRQVLDCGSPLPLLPQPSIPK